MKHYEKLRFWSTVTVANLQNKHMKNPRDHIAQITRYRQQRIQQHAENNITHATFEVSAGRQQLKHVESDMLEHHQRLRHPQPKYYWHFSGLSHECRHLIAQPALLVDYLPRKLSFIPSTQLSHAMRNIAPQAKR